MSLTPRPSAVMCANYLIALGMLKRLTESRVAVPLGHGHRGLLECDVSFASMLSPPLSSVRQPKYELGAIAAELLLEEA